MTSGKHRKAAPPAPASRRTVILGGAALLAAAAVGAVTWRRAATPRPAAAPRLASGPDSMPGGAVRIRRETRPTLDPARFVGKARSAHEVAREIPDVLDQLYCYCYCDRGGHKSLLSCYTDGHAAT